MTCANEARKPSNHLLSHPKSPRRPKYRRGTQRGKSAEIVIRYALTCCDKARNQARKPARRDRFARQERPKRTAAESEFKQISLDPRFPAGIQNQSFFAVYLRFRATFAPPTCLSAPPSPYLRALPRRSITWLQTRPRHRCKSLPDFCASNMNG